MKKASKQYFILLFILLFAGFIKLYADSQYTFDAENACFTERHHNPNRTASIGSELTDVEKRHYAETEVQEHEEKEEEVSSPHSDLPSGSYLTAFFYGPLTGLFTGKLGRAPGYINVNARTAAFRRYIRFQVFRI